MWKRLRGSSSGSESPVNKLAKNNQRMASGSPPSTIVSTESTETNKLLETIVIQNADLKSSMLETITKVKTELTNEIQNQIEYLVASFEKRITENNCRIDEISERVAKLECSCKIRDPLDDCELCIVIFGLPEQPNENVTEAVSTMLQSIDLRPNIVSAKRLPSRTARSGYRQNPGVIKIALTSLDEKVKILRAKRQLDTVGGSYRRVYMRSSETHAERLIKLNAQILLKELPNGDKFKVTGNGRIIHRYRDTEPPVVHRELSPLHNSVGHVNNYQQVSDNVFHASSSPQNTYHKTSRATGQGHPPYATGQGPPTGATAQGPPPGPTAQGPARSNSASYNHGGARPRVSYQHTMIPNGRNTYANALLDPPRQPRSKTDTRPSIQVPDHNPMDTGATAPMDTRNVPQSMFASSRLNDSNQQTRANPPGSDTTGTNVHSSESTSSVLMAAHNTLFPA